MTQEIDEFWHNYNIKNSELLIAMDDLHLITTYILSRMKKCSTIICDLSITEAFLT